VAILQTLQDFEQWKAAGALRKTDIPAAERLAPSRRDDDGRSMPIAVYGLSYAYDPRQVAIGQVSRSATGLADPRWRDPSYSLPFQCLAIPVRQSGSSFVGALEKLQQRLL
jgi:hypothetical protein